MKSHKDCGMFLLRLVVGIVFMVYGWNKIQGMEGTIGFFASLGLAPFFAYLVAWVEFLGGIALILGLYSRLVSYLLAIIVIVAILKVKWAMGFMGGYESDLVLLAALLAIAWTGAGRYSLSTKLCGCDNCGPCGLNLFCKKEQNQNTQQ